MHSRIVSIASLILAIVSVVFFLACVWDIMSHRMAGGDGVLAMAGWLMAALIFTFRFEDPQWLDPISIVKSR